MTMLGLLGLRNFGAYRANITDLSEEQRPPGVLKVHGKGDKVFLTPLPPYSAPSLTARGPQNEQTLRP